MIPKNGKCCTLQNFRCANKKMAKKFRGQPDPHQLTDAKQSRYPPPEKTQNAPG
jgi:hypothetical protein